METNSQQKVGRDPFSTRVAHYENREGVQLLERVARKRGLSHTSVLRMLLREEGQRLGMGEPVGD